MSNKNWLTLTGLALLIACASAFAERPTDLSREVQFKIPAQRLSEALIAFSAQSGIQIVTAGEDVSKLSTSGVSGRLSISTALHQLLNGTPLAYATIGDSTVALVNQSAPQAANGAHKPFIRLTQSKTPASQASTRSADSNAQQTADDSNEKAGTIQEILVTAQKREQRLQDVPASIGVVTADDIDRRGLIGASDYLRGVAGVNQVEAGYGGQLIIIRGMETSTRPQNFYSGPTTATYFGETPTTNSAGLLGSNVDIKLVDIERVEMLRGPQGTAFGSSSLGGAVRTIPVAPKLDRVEAKFGAGYSQTAGNGSDNHMFQAVGNVPLIEGKLALRGTAYLFEDSGVYRNRAASDAAFQAATVIPFGAQALATDEDGVGASRTKGGRIAALFQPTEELRLTLTYLKNTNEIDGYALATSGTFDQSLLRVGPEHVRRGQSGGLNDTEVEIANAVVEYDLGWGDLLATYSNVDGGMTIVFPQGLFINWAASQARDLTHHEHAAEVRLATKLEGAWNFLGGLYYEKLDDRYAGDAQWVGSAASNIFAPGTRFLGTYLETRDLNQKAAFGEVSWQFMPRWTLTGGARAYKYDRSFAVNGTGPLYGAAGIHQGGDSDESGTTFRANLSFKPGENAMVYAGWAQGFRLGRPQPPQTNPLCDVDNNGIYDGTSISISSSGILESDSVDSYEVGTKFAAFDRRLAVDAAVFRMDWKNIPIVQLLPCLAAITANAGLAKSEGVEFQANFQVTNAVRVDFGGSYVRARLTEDVPAQGFHAGDQLPGAPKVNANLGLQYEFNIASHPAFVRADAIKIGAFHDNIIQSPVNESGGYVKLDTTARVTINNLNVDLYVRNLTNEDDFTTRGSGPYSTFYGYRLRPRTYGVTLGYQF